MSSEGRMDEVFLESLRVEQFRCFEQREWEIPRNGLLITGPNAVGKTSLLEAICLVLRLASPRERKLAIMARTGGSSFGLAATLMGQQLKFLWSKETKVPQLFRDLLPSINQHDYLEHGGLVVWFGNDDLELVKGAAEVRRRYLDFLGSQLILGYRESLARYRMIVKSRNAILRSAKNPSQSLDLLAAYEEQFLREGQFIRESRQNLLIQLADPAGESHEIIGQRGEKISFEYQMKYGEDLRKALEKQAEMEWRQGCTLCGPHRDDVKLMINSQPVESYASEGQQRTLAVALKLAQAKLLETCTGRVPIYLIDDVFGELDLERRNALMGQFPEQAQVFITTTNLDWLKSCANVEKWKRLSL